MTYMLPQDEKAHQPSIDSFPYHLLGNQCGVLQIELSTELLTAFMGKNWTDNLK